MSPRPIVLDARTATAHFPGIGRYTVGLARALAAQVEARGLTLLHGPSPDVRLPLDVLPGIPCGASPFDLRQQWELRRVLRDSGARLYHSPYYLMPFAPGVRAVVTCYDMIPLTVSALFSPARRLAFRLAHALAFHAASAIIVPSAATRDDVARYFPAHESKIEVLPIGWEFPAANGTDTDPVMRRQLGVPDAYVLSVGSNKPHKNLRVLVDAWAQVTARCGDRGALPPLVLAGPRDPRFDHGGSAADDLQKAGRLIPVGPVPDAVLAALYRGATLFVLPSIAEGFGLPVIEAMGHGAPVVCSRIRPLLELTGGAAATFDPHDASALAGLLEELLASRSDREELRIAGLARAADFSWARVAHLTAMLYSRMLGEQS